MQPIVYENLLVQCGICKIYEHYGKEYLKNKKRDEERRGKNQEKETQEKWEEQGWKLF